MSRTLQGKGFRGRMTAYHGRRVRYAVSWTFGLATCIVPAPRVTFRVTVMPAIVPAAGESVQTFSRILCTFGRVFCRHRRTIFRRNRVGIMGNECFRCGAWWPSEVKRSALACELDKNAGRAMREHGVKKLEMMRANSVPAEERLASK